MENVVIVALKSTGMGEPQSYRNQACRAKEDISVDAEKNQKRFNGENLAQGGNAG